MVELFLHVRIREDHVEALRDGIELYCRTNGGELVDAVSGTPGESQRCPECGEPMVWDPALLAFTCPHDEG